MSAPYIRPAAQLSPTHVVETAAPPNGLADLVITPRSACLLAVLTVTLTLATSSGAAAAVIASSVRGYDGGPALASDGRVVVGELRGNGALRVLAVDPATRAVTTLQTFAPVSDPLTYNALVVSGSGGIVTATLRRWREATGVQSGPEQDIPVATSSRSMTLLPALATLFACPKRSPFSEPDAAGGDGFVATIGSECATTSASVTIRSAAGTLTIPALPATPVAGDPPTPNIRLLRAAGPFVAWTEEHRPVPGGVVARSIVVARGATGQILLRTPIPSYPYQLGVGVDGTVAFGTTFCTIGVVSPAEPVLRAFKPPQDLCDSSRSDRSLAVAGGRVVYGALTGYAISDLRDVTRPLADARSRGQTVNSPVAFDGRTVFVVRRDCDADRLLAVDADAAAGPLPALANAPGGTCPLRRSGSGRVRVARDGRVRIALRCAKGCRGTLRLVQERRGGRQRLIGEAAYSHGPGTLAVRPRIAGYARALAGCSGGLRANAVVFVSDTSTTPRSSERVSLGAYRIASSARCRRGGPAFTVARRGPRP